MFWKRVFAVIFLGVLVASGQSDSNAKPAAHPGKKSRKRPAPTSKSTMADSASKDSKPVARPKSFDMQAMDTTVDPCEDFYEYACGSWRKSNPIPSDQSRWGRFNELNEYNRQTLHQILEKAAVKSAKRTPIMQKIGDFYATCMDEKTIDSKGSIPLKQQLDRIAAISSKDQFIDTVAYLHAQGVGGGGGGSSILFNFAAQPELHNASVEIANVTQGGLGLPDRDYYLNTDAKSRETRDKYRDHMVKMFVLLGDE